MPMLGSGLVMSDEGDPLAENMGERKLLSWVISFPHLGLSLPIVDNQAQPCREIRFLVHTMYPAVPQG